MIYTFSLRQLWKKANLFIMIIILLVVVFYIFPCLVKLIWQQDSSEEKMRQQYLLEKPLRVHSMINSS
jgi:membrane protein YdbS with pleckstrin-like domain